MANVLASALAVVGVIIMLTSLLTWTAYMLPRPVARAQRRIETHPWQSFFVGIVVLAVGFGVYVVALSFRAKLREKLEYFLEHLFQFAGVSRFNGDAGTLAHDLLYLVLIPFLFALVIGGASFATLFARRVDVLGKRPLACLVGGAFAMSTSMFVPLVGWFIFSPIITAMAAGAGMVSIFTRDPQSTN